MVPISNIDDSGGDDHSGKGGGGGGGGGGGNTEATRTVQSLGCHTPCASLPTPPFALLLAALRPLPATTDFDKSKCAKDQFQQLAEVPAQSAQGKVQQVKVPAHSAQG